MGRRPGSTLRTTLKNGAQQSAKHNHGEAKARGGGGQFAARFMHRDSSPFACVKSRSSGAGVIASVGLFPLGRAAPFAALTMRPCADAGDAEALKFDRGRFPRPFLIEGGARNALAN